MSEKLNKSGEPLGPLPKPAMQERVRAVGLLLNEGLKLDRLYVDDAAERAPDDFHEALGQAALAAVQKQEWAIVHPAPNPAEALEADPMAYRCPECGAVKPPMGVAYTQAEVPGMGELIYATLFCGQCRVILTTQILELQTAGLAAQKAGFDPGGAGGPRKSGLWTPGGRGN